MRAWPRGILGGGTEEGAWKGQCGERHGSWWMWRERERETGGGCEERDWWGGLFELGRGARCICRHNFLVAAEPQSRRAAEPSHPLVQRQKRPPPPRIMGGNRKERRAAGKGANANATSTGAAFQPSNFLDEEGVNMILEHPDRSGPKGKTLFELAEERQRELDLQNGKKPRLDKDKDNTPPGERPFNDEPLTPLQVAVLYSATMAICHLTLDILVYSQYREDVVWREIFTRAATALPIFFLLVYLAHVDFSTRFPLLRNLAFFVGAIQAGCYLVYSGNKHGYFYVMKAAPPVATLWVWSTIEMDVQYSALSALSVLAYSWWNDFTFF